jgi:DNA mismatch repair protein MutL
VGSIQLLNDDVINKIAAGEVVERPASVVKELVENAIDAGARRIEVRLELGGTALLSVSDDGRGMDRADAKAALQRHATSKIANTDDLFQIATMGFRGEALASIASVSKFTLCTVQPDADHGTKVVANGGSDLDVRDWNGPAGTTITVENLFYNVPVRAKFLKSPATEYAQCLELIHAFSLCHPGVGFTLIHNNKEQFSVPALDTEADGVFGEAALLSRAKSVVGKDAASLVYVQDESRFGRVEALVSPPGIEKTSGKHLFLFVNKRWVKDKTVRYGVMRGYHTHLLKGRYPIAIVRLHMDPTLVDVNVHPAKTELRFQYPSDVQALLAQAIRKGLRNPVWTSPAGDDAPQQSEPRIPFETEVSTRSYNSSLSYRPTSTTTVQSFRGHGPKFGAGKDFSSPSISGPEDLERMLATSHYSKAAELETESSSRVPWEDLTYVGCFADCYLLFSDENRLLAVDQHAFHERILYERLKKDQNLLKQTQRLLMPEAIDLRPSQVAFLASEKDALAERGFGFEIESESCIAVTCVPAILAGKDLVGVIAELAGDPSDLDTAGDYKNRLDSADLVLATIACHSAVRSGEHLSDDDLAFLIKEAATVDFYHNCPHGRRVFRWWSKGQVARWFDR